MLYLIGLGLGDETDITLRGLNALKKCSRIYLESYTSILGIPASRLEELYGKKVVLADREMVEQGAEEILRGAEKEDIGFLVVGDPFGATTHTDLSLRAREKGIKTRTIHNASIINAVSSCGLQLYNFGQVVSVPFFTDNWRPSSFYPRIKENKDLGLHTLVLLDIKVKEQSFENLARGRKIYEPPRYMAISTACSQLLEIESQEKLGICTPSTLAVGLARVGADDEKIVAGTLEELQEVDFGGPLHSLIIVGAGVHEIEVEYLKGFVIEGSKCLDGLGV